MEIAPSGVKPRLGYSSLQSQLQLATPKSLQISDYHPSSVATMSCESFNYQDELSASPQNRKSFATNLPTKPNRQLCSCMMDSLHCIVNYSVLMESAKVIPTPTEWIQSKRRKYCSENRDLCRAIEGDSVTGEYGSYLMCNATEKGSWVLNKVYSDSNSNISVCTSNGGLIQKLKPPLSECKIFLDQAGLEGTGIISYNPEDIELIQLHGATLGNGTKAGIAVSVFVALTLIVSVILWVRFKQQRRMKNLASQNMIELPGTAESKKKEIKDSNSSHNTHELEGIELQELSTANQDAQLQELSATDNEVRELEGDGTVLS